MSKHRIGLTDDQRAILDRRLRALVRERERLQELVRVLGGEGAVYDHEAGMILLPDAPSGQQQPEDRQGERPEEPPQVS